MFNDTVILLLLTGKCRWNINQLWEDLSRSVTGSVLFSCIWGFKSCTLPPFPSTHAKAHTHTYSYTRVKFHLVLAGFCLFFSSVLFLFLFYFSCFVTTIFTCSWLSNWLFVRVHKKFGLWLIGRSCFFKCNSY